MGLVPRGMLWCYCFTNFVNHSIVTVKMEEKTSKTWRLMDKQNHPTFPYRPPNLLFTIRQKKKKSSPAFANFWLLLIVEQRINSEV